MFRKLAVLFITLSAIQSKASPSYLLSNNTPENQHLLLAQASEDDSFDPFSDYSEFDEATEEEADINFFRNGRFLTVGFFFGFKGFTDSLADIYTSGGTYGLFISYFFDLRFAVQFGFNTGDYPFSVSDAANNKLGGNVGLSAIQLLTKYYFNTQNVTKGLADLNPYMLIGFSDHFKTTTVTSSTTNQVTNAVTSAWGIDLGGGIEIPMLRKKAFFGFQFTYHYVNFSDSNSPVWMSATSTYSKQTQSGAQYDLVGLVGVNF